MIEIPKGWKLKVAIVSSNDGFCYYYRLKWPLSELEENGLIETIGVDVGTPNFSSIMGETFSNIIDWADVLVFSFSNPPEIVVRYSDYCNHHKIPKLFVSEFDDDYTSIHPSNAYYRMAGIENVQLNNGKWVWKDNDICDHLNEYKDKTKEEKEHLKFNILRNKIKMARTFRANMYSDIITTTTPELANIFKKWNDNVAVLPNYINPEVMPEGKKKPRDHVLIGWQGGASHHHDLKMIMPALKEIKNIYKEKVHFVFRGAGFVDMYKQLDADFIDWVDPCDFYKTFSDNLFDIGLIPLVDPKKNVFNKSKSNIKWLEYSHYGIPSVVSGYKPYSQHIDDRKTGLLCYSTKDWVNALKKLIDDPLYRFKVGSEAKKVTDRNFTIQQHAHKWYDLYMGVLTKKVENMSKS